MTTWHRQVFFIGGFDPKNSAAYHRLYRDAVAHHPTSAQGETVGVSKQREREGLYTHWEMHWQPAGQAPVRSRYTVLGWHDIVLAHWPRNLGRILRDYLFVYGHAGLDGTFAGIYRSSPAAFWLALFPLLLGLGLMLVLGLAGGLLAGWLDDQALLGAATGVFTGFGLWRVLAQVIDSVWLLRLYGFTFAQARHQIPALEERLEQFADRLIEAAQPSAPGTDAPSREILLVGHSTGAILAAQVMARALEKAPWLGQRGPALAMLTLGHCTPVLAMQPPAKQFRQQLAALADTPQLTWVDYSAPPDWAVFAKTPPWLAYRGRARLLATTPRFHKVLGPARYRHILKLQHRHELHMQYLRAPELPGGYDLVTLTASPATLAQQHANLFPEPTP